MCSQVIQIVYSPWFWLVSGVVHDLYTPNLSLRWCIVIANPKIFKCGLIPWIGKVLDLFLDLWVVYIKSRQTLQRLQPDQGLPITHYDITAWTLMLLELQCRFRCNIVTVLHCQYRGKYLIYCVLIVLSQCEWFKLYFLKFLDNNVPTCNEVRHQWLFWNWWQFSSTKFKKEKKKLLCKCKPGYILNIKMAFDLFNEFSFIPSRIFS